MVSKDEVAVRIRRLEHGRDLPLPDAASPASAGWDLRAAIPSPFHLAPGERARIPTGVALAIPPGWEGQVRPRSGLAASHGVTVLNTPGTIDADYRGEIGVILINTGTDIFTIQRGDRIGQIVFSRVARVVWRECEQLEETARGDGGFGSTGRS